MVDFLQDQNEEELFNQILVGSLVNISDHFFILFYLQEFLIRLLTRVYHQRTGRGGGGIRRPYPSRDASDDEGGSPPARRHRHQPGNGMGMDTVG